MQSNEYRYIYALPDLDWWCLAMPLERAMLRLVERGQRVGGDGGTSAVRELLSNFERAKEAARTAPGTLRLLTAQSCDDPFVIVLPANKPLGFRIVGYGWRDKSPQAPFFVASSVKLPFLDQFLCDDEDEDER